MTSACYFFASEDTHEMLRLFSTNYDRHGVSRVSMVQIHLYNNWSHQKIRAERDELLDTGYLELLEDSVVKVLKPCSCEKPLWHKGFALASAQRLTKLQSARHTQRQLSESSQVLSSVRFPWRQPGETNQTGSRYSDVAVRNKRFKVESAQKPEQRLSSVYLAKFYFPATCRKHHLGSVGDQNSVALASTFGRWKREDDITLEEIRDMIDVYAAHPEWTTGKIAWKDFIKRREYLLKQVRVEPQTDYSRPADSDPSHIYL